jgi:hypothetical protein
MKSYPHEGQESQTRYELHVSGVLRIPEKWATVGASGWSTRFPDKPKIGTGRSCGRAK